MPFEMPFALMSTGWGATTTWDHRVATDWTGKVFPVAAEITGGYRNQRFKFQIIPTNRPIVLAVSRRRAGEKELDEIQIVKFPSSFSIENDIPINLETLATVSTRDEPEKLRKRFPKLRPSAIWPVFVQVYHWGPGRQCHFPPGVKDITPVYLSDWGIILRTLEEAAEVFRALSRMLRQSMQFSIDPGLVVKIPNLQVNAGLLSNMWRFYSVRETPLWTDRISAFGAEIRFSRPVAILSEMPSDQDRRNEVFWTPEPVEVSVSRSKNKNNESLPAEFGQFEILEIRSD